MQQNISNIVYRPHIDGLRGIAIIAVVLYHAKLLKVTGGYVGVDVFFVISGFLITSIILRELRAGSFSLIEFWEKRVRRIIPALFLVMCTTFLAAYLFLLYPEDYHHFGKAVVAQSLFVSNMFFMQSDNYFDQPTHYSPLLHTWTLSVEEQFYIFFPVIIILLLWLIKRTRNYFLLGETLKSLGQDRNRNNEVVLLFAILLISAFSFFLNIWLIDIHPQAQFSNLTLQKFFPNTTFATAGFFLLPPRLWELGLGALIALFAINIRSNIRGEILGFIGLFAVFMAIFVFDDRSFFPGMRALLPTLGAAAFIIANENKLRISGRLLSYPQLVWIGLISYSLYLWHWPILVFARVISHTPISTLSMMGLLLMTVVISWISFRYIETPIIRKTWIVTRKNTFILGILALSLMMAGGEFIQRSVSQRTSRIPSAGLKILLTNEEGKSRSGVCFPSVEDKGEYQGLCRIGNNKGTKADFILWGDSHADAMVPLFVELGWRYGAQGSVFALADCAPVIGTMQKDASSCEAQNKLAMRYIRDHHVMKIFLVARWNHYVMEGANKIPTAFLNIGGLPSDQPIERAQTFEKYFIPMVTELAREGREVYIIKQAPEQFTYDPRTEFYRTVRTGEFQLAGTKVKDDTIYGSLSSSVIEKLNTKAHVKIIEPASVLCKNGICDLMSEGNLLYRDENHLSVPGVMKLEPLFQSAFESVYP